jgi:hypothetical protein
VVRVSPVVIGESLGEPAEVTDSVIEEYAANDETAGRSPPHSV